MTCLFTDRRTGRTLGWLGGLLAAAALQAAPVNAPVNAPGDVPGGATGSGAVTGGRVLDKALSGEVSTGSQNLDMLLEMHRSDASDADRPVLTRPGAPGATGPGAPPAPAAAPARPAVTPGLARGGLLGGEGGLGSAMTRSDRPAAHRDWRGDGAAPGPGQGAMGETADGVATGERSPPPWFIWPRQLIDFVREYHNDLLGGAVLLLVLGAAGRFVFRRLDRRPGRRH